MGSVVATLNRRKIEPKPHQLETVGFKLANLRGYNLSACGSGKTLPSVLALRILFTQANVDRILVVAPLSVIRATWVDHLEQFAPEIPILLMDQSHKRQKQIKDMLLHKGIVLVNPDGVSSIVHDLRAWRPQLVVIDELSGYYRNCRTDRWKAMNLLINVWGSPACWAFTGTPITKNIMDCYAQCLLVNPSMLPQRRGGGPVSFVTLRDMLCLQPWPNVWVPKPDGLERAFSYMQPAIRFTRQQVMKDIKEPVRMRKDVALTPEQKQLLDKMIADGKAQYGGQVIKGTEARALVTKLTQIVLGSVYDAAGNVLELPYGPRLQAVVDLHNEVECTPVIVAAPFIHTIHRLEKDLTAKGYRVAVIIGEVAVKVRLEIIERFQRGEIDFLVCHPKTLAHGVTLTCSSTICWFGPHYDLELYAQLNDRIFRYGQQGQPLIVELCSTATEAKVYASLRNKEQLSGKFLDLFGK